VGGAWQATSSRTCQIAPLTGLKYVTKSLSNTLVTPSFQYTYVTPFNNMLVCCTISRQGALNIPMCSLAFNMRSLT